MLAVRLPSQSRPKSASSAHRFLPYRPCCALGKSIGRAAFRRLHLQPPRAITVPTVTERFEDRFTLCGERARQSDVYRQVRLSRPLAPKGVRLATRLPYFSNTSGDSRWGTLLQDAGWSDP